MNCACAILIHGIIRGLETELYMDMLDTQNLLVFNNFINDETLWKKKIHFNVFNCFVFRLCKNAYISFKERGQS